MFRVDANNNERLFTGQFETQELAQEWVSKRIELNSWGKPERWVISKDYMPENDFLPGPIEDYDPSDVLETEDRNMGTEDDPVMVPYVKLKAEYTYAITDLSQTYEYQLEQCYKARREAYGPIAEQLDEQFHNFDAWKARIAQVKLDNPKPQE